MSEAQTYTFTYRELAEILVREQDIHEGIWGVHIEFALGAANIPQAGSTDLIPAAIVPVKAVGIHRYQEPSNLTVDAAEVNPIVGTAAKHSRRKK